MVANFVQQNSDVNGEHEGGADTTSFHQPSTVIQHDVDVKLVQVG